MNNLNGFILLSEECLNDVNGGRTLSQWWSGAKSWARSKIKSSTKRGGYAVGKHSKINGSISKNKVSVKFSTKL